MAEPPEDRAKAPGPAPSADSVGTGSLSPSDISPRPASGSSGAAHRPTFAPGEVIAGGRYRIVRFIAKGGMGEVYEAEDLAIAGRVALKTIRPEIAREPRAAERFKREIHVARKVTHPNVCRIYDLGTHRGAADTEGQEVLFLTMELLVGESLSERIARGGKLTTAEALPILTQVAAGLDSAHAAGVIHRDFKSGNVMLVPDPPRGTRAVITDFGLARGVPGESVLESISDTNTVVGTPAYMAPEQVQGLPLTPAADIYALGVVMFEMLTGVRPFEANTPLSMAVRRVTEDPPTPRLYVPNLDPLWETVILRCMARDPTARFAPASGALRELGRTDWPATESLLVPSLVRPRPRERRYGVAAGIVLAVLGAAFLVWLARKPPSAPPPTPGPSAAAVTPRRAVAVLGFKNVSEQADFAWLSPAIAEMLRTDLAAGGKLRAIPGDDVARARRDLSLVDAETYTAELANRIRVNLGADLLVFGSYTVIGGTGSRLVRVDLRLQDGARGELLTSGTANGTEAQIFDLVSRAAAPLREKLGLGSVSPAEAIRVEASLPSNPEAARLYSAGLVHLQSLDSLGARDLLEKAIAADPNHPLPHAALSAAWSALGYRGKARDEARTAAELASGLPDEDRLSIEARLHEANNDWPKAIETYRALSSSSPDNLEWGLRLAEVQTAGGRPKEALVTVQALRRLPSPGSDDPRIDLIEARAFKELGDFTQARALAARAASRGAAREARVLVARARLVEALALDMLGDPKGATAAGEEARRLFEAAGDRSGVARALERMGITLQGTGDLNGAQRLYEKALTMHRETGDEGSVARVLHNLGNLLLEKGRGGEADTFLEQSLTTFNRIGAKREAAEAQNTIAKRLYESGDLAGAQKRYQEALTLFGGIGQKRGVAEVLTNLGELLLARGDLDQARQMYEESLAIGRELGDKSVTAYGLFRMGELFLARADLGVARGRYEEALAIQEQTGEKIAAAQTRLGLASLALAEERAAEAEGLARGAEELMRVEGETDGAALAQLLLAQSLLAQGKLEGSRNAVDKAQAVAAKSEDFGVKMAVAIAAARVGAASRQPASAAAALRSLASANARAVKVGFLVYAYEARLALGEIELASGNAATGKPRLRALAKDAAAKGFGLIARKAEKAATTG